MARKKKAPPEKPSKAYLVSFGDTMTALLAFFIVLNSFAKEQTGANMHSGTGSFLNSMSSIGLPGRSPGDRSKLVNHKKAPSPVYAIDQGDAKENNKRDRLGPDEDPDQKRIIDRQMENFKRFLTEVDRVFDVNEMPPTKSEIVLDSFEKFRRRKKGETTYLPLQKNAIQVSSEAIMLLLRQDYELEIVIWANMPGKISLENGMEIAEATLQQIESIFVLTDMQKSRLTVSCKPWLFSDAARPKMSFIVSKMDLAN